MRDPKYSIVAITGFVIGILLTIYAWYMVDGLTEMLELPSMKAIFWIGLITYWCMTMIVTPLTMIMGGQGNWKGAVKGIVVFAGGYVLMLLTYHIGGLLIEIMDSIYPNSTFVAILWFGIYTIWILGCIVAPAYLTIQGALDTG